MKRYFKGLLYVLATLFLAVPAGVRGENEFVNVEQLSERVRLLYWAGIDRRCNLTAIQTRKGLVLIDTEMSPRIMAPIKKRIEQAFGRSDWACVINTHAHDNHAGGNSLFKGVPIVGHANLAEDMQWMIHRQTEPDVKQQELNRAAAIIRDLRECLPLYERNPAQSRLIRGEIKFRELHNQDLQEGYSVVQPSVTFADKKTLDCGDVKLELEFFGKGHSLSDILIYVPQEKLLVTGAIVYQRAQLPEIGEGSQREDLERFLAVLDRFLAAEVQIDHVVSAHSPPLRKQDLAPVRDYYQRMLAGVRAAQRANHTFEQARARLAVARNFPAFREKPEGTWSHGMHDRNLRNLWRILSEDQPQTQRGQGTNDSPSASSKVLTP